MRGTRSAFKNVSRDIFIGDRDIQLVVQKLEERAKNLQNFSYEFFHDGHELKAIFWADDVSKVDYHMFGDVLGFDATYSTNNTYCFKKAFHSLCMWHIMKKLPSKDVQKKIFKGMMNCFISNVDVVDQSKVFTISHMNHNMDFVNEFKIAMLQKRWRRQILPCRVYSISNRLAAYDSKESMLKNQAMNCVSDCVDKLTGSFESLSAFVDKMKDIKKSVFDENPGGIRNKGFGTNRRLVGQGERAIEKNKKNPGLCRSCNQLTFHDSRNYKLRSDNESSG
ncbi:hypothetical protein E3N88_29579 [Mikania micrantha]|uniref:Protein FAR1-RELATED SEQUENCE n=1 Tax=Mikania micrantha TaxID=192012 RepID=A0A5N6MJV3_9ASTR|nr:hypothetical protein E3N88_29579 [Mikania micrantha]